MRQPAAIERRGAGFQPVNRKKAGGTPATSFVHRQDGCAPLRGSLPNAFTFVEVLVALCIGAMVLGAVAMAFSTIVVNGPQRTKAVNVEIGTSVFNNFYGGSQSAVAAGQAPDFGAAAMAEGLREWFCADVSSAVAVFSLGRNGRSSAAMRLSALPVATNFDARTLNSPGAFAVFLDPSATVFSPYTGAMTATNSSTYILGRSTNAAEVTVRAIYETDLLATTSPPGVYASVRRYQGTNFTGYYHVFYPNETNGFRPLAVFFDRSALTNGSAAADTYRQAANRPFYFLWWPDPAAGTLADRIPYDQAPASTTEPRAEYYQIGGKTSLFFVVPAFPPL
jgi:hypothetical protein